MLEVTSPQNRIIKEIKSLYRRKNRWDKNLFIIEGPKIIEEALTEQIKLKYLVFGESFLENKESAYLIEMAGNYQKIKVTDRLFEEISDTESPQGILAVATFIERRLEDICIKDQPFLVYLDQVQDPGNIGTIIRTADAFNIDGIILGKGTVDPYNPKVVRATMGSIFRVPLYFCQKGDKLLQGWKEKGLKLIATSLEGSRVDERDFRSGSLLIIGNEARGVDVQLMNQADKLVKIPMPGKAESLNASVAASILMYEAMKGRRDKS